MMYGKVLSRSFRVDGSCKCRHYVPVKTATCSAGKNGKTGKSGSVDVSAVGASVGKKYKGKSGSDLE